jgi:hypothetical protein
MTQEELGGEKPSGSFFMRSSTFLSAAIGAHLGCVHVHVHEHVHM